jgi:hypothetical protein
MFPHSLINDAVSNADRTATNDGTIINNELDVIGTGSNLF